MADVAVGRGPELRASLEFLGDLLERRAYSEYGAVCWPGQPFAGCHF